MENQNLFDLRIDDESVRYLKETAKWGRFLSILAFIFIGFYILFFLFAALLGSFSGEAMETMQGNAANPMGAMFASGAGLAFMIAYFALLLIPVVYMYRFSTRMRNALDRGDQVLVADAFGNLKSMFKFYGILTIILLGLVVLGFIGAIIVLGTNLG